MGNKGRKEGEHTVINLKIVNRGKVIVMLASQDTVPGISKVVRSWQTGGYPEGMLMSIPCIVNDEACILIRIRDRKRHEHCFDCTIVLGFQDQLMTTDIHTQGGPTITLSDLFALLAIPIFKILHLFAHPLCHGTQTSLKCHRYR